MGTVPKQQAGPQHAWTVRQDDMPLLEAIPATGPEEGMSPHSGVGRGFQVV